ncbi:MAG: hypothetical protein ACI4SR_03755 [Faecalibacillus sp.]
MKQFVIEFDDEEIEMLEEQLHDIQDTGMFETLEDYVHYATISHCKTMKVASQMVNQAGGLERLMSDDNIHIGVVNMPVQLSNQDDKEEFGQYLNQVINEAVKDFNNRNNGPLN